MALGFSFLFLYLIQGLFKEREVHSSPAPPVVSALDCQYMPTQVPSLWPRKS